MKKLTNEEKHAQYIAKKEAIKAQRKADHEWFTYRLHIACSADYLCLENYHEYIVYCVLGTGKKYHVDLPNGMKFTCTEYKEISEIIENYA